MKKILFIVHNLKVGGIQKITVELARHHVAIGNEVHILCLQKGLSIDIDFKCHLHSIDLVAFLTKHPLLAIYYGIYKTIFRYLLPASEFFFAKAIFKPQILSLLNSLESSGKFDAIFIRGMRSIQRTWWLNRQEAVHSLHMPHSLRADKHAIFNNYNRWVSQCLFKDKVFFSVSQYIASPLIKSLKQHDILPKVFSVINNPCDIDRVNRLSEENLQVVKDKYILGVGRLTKQKRFDVLINAFHKANVKNCKLVILGEGNQREHLEALINDLELKDKVVMPGFTSNPYPWYKMASLFVLSSDYEGFGNVIVESLACGTPVLSTDCGPVSEILKGRLSAGIVPKGDAISLANKIRDYLEKPILPTNNDIECFSFNNIVTQQMAMVNAVQSSK